MCEQKEVMTDVLDFSNHLNVIPYEIWRPYPWEKSIQREVKSNKENIRKYTLWELKKYFWLEILLSQEWCHNVYYLCSNTDTQSFNFTKSIIFMPKWIHTCLHFQNKGMWTCTWNEMWNSFTSSVLFLWYPVVTQYLSCQDNQTHFIVWQKSMKKFDIMKIIGP